MTDVAKMAKYAGMETPGERLRKIRIKKGFRSGEAYAERFPDISASGLRAQENGQNDLTPAVAQFHADNLGIRAAWLLYGELPIEKSGEPLPPMLSAPRPSNARIGEPVQLDETVPVYGHAVGGVHGEFVLNGNKVDDILAPRGLSRTMGAYAVYVVGDSMEPRYYAGEAVFVNPRLPVRRYDYVVAQIYVGDAAEGEAPAAFVKRFISRDTRTLRLMQHNPSEVLEFPAERVASIHRIIMGGDG